MRVIVVAVIVVHERAGITVLGILDICIRDLVSSNIISGSAL